MNLTSLNRICLVRTHPVYARRERAIVKKILVIDDDELIRETVRLALAHAGFEVATLGDAERAPSVAAETKPDLILLDLYMGETSGLDLCRRLKADEATRGIPVIVLSGSNEPVDVLAGIDAGAVEYLKKPIDAETLVRTVRSALKLEDSEPR